MVEAFGEGILAADGTVDRRKLGEIVFQDHKAALSKLNCIVRPLMAEEVQSRLKELRRKKTRVAVLEAALLIEAGWSPLVDEIWVTTAPESVIYKRLAAKRESIARPDSGAHQSPASGGGAEKIRHARHRHQHPPAGTQGQNRRPLGKAEKLE